MSEPTRRQALHALKAHQAQHAGLWLDKFLENQARKTPGARESAPESARDTARHRLMLEATGIPLPASYDNFFTRWERALAELPGAILRRRAQATGRVIVGLGNESPCETAITLHHTFGAPYLPGSALKGLAAFYARNFLEDAGWRAIATGAPGPAYRTLFGDTTLAGCVTFYDAYYIPGSVSDDRMLHTDTITVHHPEYNQGSAPPADWDSPTPLPFVSANGAYLVALGGADAVWVDAGLAILGLALAELGIGAKTSSGYGRMSLAELPATTTPRQPAAAQPHSKAAAPQRPMAETPVHSSPRQRGQIKTVKDNFAFIQPESGGVDIYVNKNAVPAGSWPLRAGQIVEFTVEPDRTPGKVRAVQVKVMG